MSNFLKEIQTPTYDATFNNSLNDIIRDINTNFQRLVSAPFLKGDAGNSVTKVSEKLYDDDTHKFTELGVAIVNAIYGDDIQISQITINLYDDLVNYIYAHLRNSDIITINSTNHYSCEFLNPFSGSTWTNKSIDCYKIQNDTNKNFITLYYFQDLRIIHLQGTNIGINNTNFNDRSCVLYGEYSADLGTQTTYSWKISKYQSVPTIYYDYTTESFCWKINGIESGVNAQGIKGEKGDDPVIWSCHGIRYSGDQTKCVITNSILSCSKDWGSTTPIVDNINSGDIVYIWFKEENGAFPSSTPQWSGTPTNCCIGIVKNLNTLKYIEYNPFIDIASFINTVLRRHLDNIGYRIYTTIPSQTDLLGLYIPEEYKTSYSSSDKVFMLSSHKSGNDSTLYLSNNTYDKTTAGTQLPIQINHSLKKHLNIDFIDINSLPSDATASREYLHHRKVDSSSVVIDEIINNATTQTGKIKSSTGNFGSEIEVKIGQNSKGKEIYIGSTPGQSSRRTIINPDNTQSSDAEPSYQQVQTVSDGTISLSSTDTNEAYSYSNIFNFGGTVCDNGSALNFRYMSHNGLSTLATLQFGLCFNPKCKCITKGSSDYIRLYTPTLQYLRDTSSTTQHKNWAGNGSLGNSNSDPNNSNTSEVFLYDKVDLKVSNDIIESSNFTPQVTTSIASTENKYTYYYSNCCNTTSPSSIISCNKGDNFFDLNITRLSTGNTTGNSIFIVGDFNSGYWGKIFNLQTDVDITFTSTNNTTKNLGKKLPLLGIATKLINNDNSIYTYEFVYIFSQGGINPSFGGDNEFITNNTNNNYLNDYKNLCIENLNNITLSQYKCFTNNNKSCLLINFIVTYDSINKTCKISPTSSQQHASYDDVTSSTGYWKFNGNGTSSQPQVMNYSWYFLGELGKGTKINKRKLYFPAPINNWNDDLNNTYPGTLSYNKKYDLYEMGIGNTSITSRPKRELLPRSISYSLTGSLNTILLEDISSKHEFLPYNYSDELIYTPVNNNNLEALEVEERSLSSSVTNTLIGGMMTVLNTTTTNSNNTNSSLISLEEDIQRSSTDIIITNSSTARS